MHLVSPLVFPFFKQGGNNSRISVDRVFSFDHMALLRDSMSPFFGIDANGYRVEGGGCVVEEEHAGVGE